MINPRFVIKAVISGQRLNISIPLTVCGTVNYIGVEAKCTSEWDDCAVVCYIMNSVGNVVQLVMTYDAEKNIYYFPTSQRLTLMAGEWNIWFVGVQSSEGQETYRVTTEVRQFTIADNFFTGSVPQGDITLDEQAIAIANDAKHTADNLYQMYLNGDFKGDKGDTGDPARIGFVQASVDSSTTNPRCVVITTEDPEGTYNIQLDFKGIHGAKGDTGDKGDKGDKGDTGAVIDDYVLVQDTQPVSNTNKVWLKPTAPSSPIMIPTAEEFQDLKNAIELDYIEIDISEIISNVNATIASDGELKSNSNGKVAIIPFEKGIYKFAIENKPTPCRAGFSNTLYKGNSINLTDLCEIVNGSELVSTGEYNYLYIYYRTSTYNTATLATSYYKINETSVDALSNACLKNVTEEIINKDAAITSGGTVEANNYGGVVAIIQLTRPKYLIRIYNRNETVCRAGYSDTLFDGNDIILSETTTVADNCVIENDYSYRYLYIYYKGETFPHATISVMALNEYNNHEINQAYFNISAMIKQNGNVETASQRTTAVIPLECGQYMFSINNSGVFKVGLSKSIFDGSPLELDEIYTIINGSTIKCNGEYNYLYIYYRNPEYPNTILTVSFLKDEENDINPLKGKTVVAIGDSLLYGQGIERNQTWLSLLSNEYGFTSYNYGISGSPIATAQGVSDAMCVRIDSILEEHPVFDYFILEGGANDMWEDIPLGDVKTLNPDYNYTPGTKYSESTIPQSTFKYLPNLDKETFCGAINYIIKKVNETCPTARILLLTNYNRKRGRTNSLGLLDEDYVDAMIECAKFLGMPYVDNYHDIGFNLVDDCMREWADEGTNHINAAGNAWLKNIYFRKLISI